LLIPSVVFLFISGVALIFLLVLLHGFASIVTLLAVFSPALIVNSSVAFLFIHSVALLFIPSLTFLLRNILAFLFGDRIYLRNLDGVTLLLIDSCGEGLLHGVTLLPRFIPALLLPNSGTNWESSMGQTDQSQQDCSLGCS